MRAIAIYRGFTVSTNLAGGFYYRAGGHLTTECGALVCRLSMAEVRADIDRTFAAIDRQRDKWA